MKIGVLAAFLLLSAGVFALIDPAWQYQTPIAVNNGGSALTDYQVAVNTNNLVYNNSGLAGSWHFSESAGTRFADSSGNGNDGTYSGEALNNGTLTNFALNASSGWAQGRYGTALQFDGVNDYVSAAKISSSGDVTVGAWIYPRSYNIAPTHNPRILYNYDGAGDLQIILREDGYFKWGTAIGGAGVGVTSLPLLDSWTYVTVTRSGSTYRVYYNGVEQSTVSVAPGNPVPTTQALRVGADIEGTGSNGHFNGTIDDVRIYNRALSASEIAQVYQNNTFIRSGLAAYWRFDENAGAVAQDTHHIATQDNRDGARFGNGLTFDGVNDYVNAGNSTSLAFSDAVTLEAWVNVPGPASPATDVTAGFRKADSPTKGTLSNGNMVFSAGSGYSAVVFARTFAAGEDFKVVSYWAHDYRGLGMAYGPSVSYSDWTGWSSDPTGPYWGSIPVSGFPSGYSASCFCQYHAPISGGGAATTGYYFKHERKGNVLSLQYSTTSEYGPWTAFSSLSPITIAPTDKVVIGWGEASGNEVAPLRLISLEPTIVGKDGSYGLIMGNGTVTGRINTRGINASLSPGWNHIALTYDRYSSSNQQALYVNGALAAQGTLSEAITPTSNILKIGAYLNGTVDEVRVYNRSLSAQEIAQRYNASRLRPDYADLRFADSTGSSLPYWHESDSRAWVRVPSVPSGTSTVYAYYGNPNASGAGNGTATFDLFDDFSDNDYTNNPTWTPKTGTWYAPTGFLNTSNSGAEINTSSASATGREWSWRWRAPSTKDFSYYYYVGELNFIYINPSNRLYVMVDARASGSGSQIYVQKYVGGTFTNLYNEIISTSGWDSNWHTTRVSRDQNNQFKVYLDGVLKTTFTDNDLTTSSYIDAYLEYGSGTKEGDFDDIRVRKYASPEPTLSLQQEGLVSSAFFAGVSPSNRATFPNYNESFSLWVYNNQTFSDTFTLYCAGTCSVSPSSLSLSPYQNGSATVTITSANASGTADYPITVTSQANAINSLSVSVSITVDTSKWRSAWNDAYNSAYVYRVPITLNNSGGALTDYQVAVNTSNLVYDNTGLAGSWHFSEGTGARAADSSGNGNDGTLTNGPSWAAGKFGNGLSFSGGNDHLSVPGSGSLSVSDAVTLEAWVETSGAGSSLETSATVGFKKDPNPAKGTLSNNNRTFSAGAGYSSVVLAKTFAAGQDFEMVTYWAHNYRGVGMVYGPTVSHTDWTGWSSDPTGPYWGGITVSGFPSGYSGTYFGQYHAPIAGGGAATTGYYFKHKRTGNTLSLQYASSVSGPWTNILGDRAVSSSDKVTIGMGEAESNEVTPLSIVSLSYEGGIQKVGAYGLEFNKAAVSGQINNNTVTAPLSGGWNHLVLTYDKNLASGQQKLYVNGVLRAEANLTAAITANSNDLNIGSFFNGTIDEVRVYNRSLSAQEIAQRYNASRLRPDYADLRFVNSSYSQLPYWIESDNRAWVKVPYVPNGTSTIYAYYGNPSAASASSGRNTFIVFDDFATGSSEIWTMSGGVTSDRTTNNRLNINGVTGTFSAYLSKGSDIGDYEYLYDFNKTATASSEGFGVAVSNTITNDYSTSNNGAGAFLHSIGSGVPQNWLYLRQGGATYNTGGAYGSNGIHYWARLTRIGDTYAWAGYSDPARTSAVWNITNTRAGITNQQYVYAAATLSDSANAVTGWVAGIRIRKYASPEPSLSLRQEELKSPALFAGISPSSRTTYPNYNETFSLWVKNNQSVSDTFALSCAGACSVSPSSLLLAPQQNGSATVTITGANASGTTQYTITATSQANASNYASVSVSLTVDTTKWRSAWTDAYNREFRYRIPIAVTNGGAALADYQLNLTIDTASLISAGKMRSDCGDIRFTNGSIEMPYWIESGCNSTSTLVWAKVPYAPNGTSTIYAYYGNPNAAGSGSGAATFDFFDDFDRADSASVGNGWLEQERGSGNSISGGKLKQQSAGSGGSMVYRESPRQNSLVINSKFMQEATEPWTYGVFVRGTASCDFPYCGDGAGFLYWYPGTWYPSKLRIMDAATTKAEASLALTTTRWYNSELRISGANAVDAYVWEVGTAKPASPTVSQAAFTPSSAGTLLKVGHGATATIVGWTDDVFVRKYASPEPSASAGMEQSKGYRTLVRRCGAKQAGANVTAYQAGNATGSCLSDSNGICALEISAGTYDLQFRFADNSTAWKNGAVFG